MKAKLEFNLPEEDYEYKMYMKAPEMQSSIHEFMNEMRSKTKSDTMNADLGEIYDLAKEYFWEFTV